MLRPYTPAHLAEKILTSRSALEGERKQVTVLFADLKSSMELLADRDPEEAGAILDPILERMMDAVHRYEGTVNQVVGDGIMALFGAPIAHEDHAVRACYAALAMQTALRRYSDEVRRTHGLAVDFRVGLNSGEVVVRAIDNDLHMDYSAIGQTTHLAARMEQLATPGSILLTPTTLRLVEGLGRVDALGPIPIKGLAEPVEVYELVRASVLRRRLQAAVARGLTPFVGRQTEVAALQQALERAGEGHGQVVALVGEAGVGKSRLVYECVHAPQTQGWRVLESASVSYGKATLYFPVLELLRHYGRVEEHDDPPFFLEESVRTLVETGVLVGEPGAYRLAHALSTIQVPATVQAVLAARIDRLPPEEKRLLQTAAVIGTEVSLPLLQAIAERPEGTMHCGLTHLQAAEFLYETQLFPECEYTFKHALTHEVAYGSLLQERRRALHARIVEALEVLAGEWVAEQVDRLAYHALRGEVWDKALVYCRQAGERALARSAHREAVGSFEQALSALRHLPETRDTREQAIDLRLALRSALSPSGNMGRILASLREAEALAAALDDPRRLAWVSGLLSAHFYFRGAHDQAITTAQRAVACATAGGDAVLQAPANCYLGFAYQAQGDYRRAIESYMQTATAIEGALRHERFGQVFLPAVLFRARLAACHAELGTFAEGRALGDEGLRIAEAVAHPASPMDASRGLGLLALRQGDVHRALPLLERPVAICQDADLPIYFPLMAAVLGAAYTLAGRGADAVPLLTQAMERLTATEMLVYQALCRLSLGQAQMLAGRLEEAHALAERTLALTRVQQERGEQAYALHLLGDIAARREPPECNQAGEYYRQALTLAEELGMRPLQAHCHLGRGTLYAKVDQQETARTELSAAIELYQAMDMTFWLPQAEAALAQVEGR